MFQQPNKVLTRTPHSFSSVPHAEVPRSSFNRSHGYKTALYDAGLLHPIFVDEALPGDTMSLSMTTFARMATLVAPILDNLYCDVFFFAIPYRLVWDNWEKFNGAQTNPGDSTSYLIPIITHAAGSLSQQSIYDYMGLPIDKNVSHSALPLRAYNLVWNEWFRDQNLQNSVTVPTGDGPDTPATYTMLRRGKRHDYFTSALPWPQKGTAVSLPLGTTAPVVTAGTNINLLVPTSANPTLQRQWQVKLIGADNTTTTSGASVGASALPIQFGDTTGLRADLSTATAATINQLREAFQMQKLFERDARGGTRYTEIIRAHFGVTSPDYRLQRPEYLGGGSTMINMSPVPQTSGSGATPQGNLAAVGTFSHSGIGFTKSFTEHSIILGLVSIRADMNYQQGMERMWSRRTRYDFYWPALSHIGEQAILNKEIYAQGTATDDQVFGYQERYAEYRYKPSKITGKLRSTATGTLNIWHLAQNFGSLPVLGSTFIQETPSITRALAVPTEPPFLFDSVFNYKCARPMPVFSVPGLIDHF